MRVLVCLRLAELTGARSIYERSDVDVRTLEGMAPRSGPLHGDPVGEVRIVEVTAPPERALPNGTEVHVVEVEQQPQSASPSRSSHDTDRGRCRPIPSTGIRRGRTHWRPRRDRRRSV